MWDSSDAPHVEVVKLLGLVLSLVVQVSQKLQLADLLLGIEPIAERQILTSYRVGSAHSESAHVLLLFASSAGLFRRCQSRASTVRARGPYFAWPHSNGHQR